MALINTDDLLSISEASKLGVSGLVHDAESGRERILVRNNRPVAVILGMKRLEAIQRLEEDMFDASLAAARMITTGERRHSLDEVLQQFGYTRDQLRVLRE